MDPGALAVGPGWRVIPLLYTFFRGKRTVRGIKRFRLGGKLCKIKIQDMDWRYTPLSGGEAGGGLIFSFVIGWFVGLSASPPCPAVIGEGKRRCGLPLRRLQECR